MVYESVTSFSCCVWVNNKYCSIVEFYFGTQNSSKFSVKLFDVLLVLLCVKLQYLAHFMAIFSYGVEKHRDLDSAFLVLESRARHSILEVLVADNMLQASKEMKQFATEWQFYQSGISR